MIGHTFGIDGNQARLRKDIVRKARPIAERATVGSESLPTRWPGKIGVEAGSTTMNDDILDALSLRLSSRRITLHLATTALVGSLFAVRSPGARARCHRAGSRCRGQARLLRRSSLQAWPLQMPPRAGEMRRRRSVRQSQQRCAALRYMYPRPARPAWPVVTASAANPAKPAATASAARAPPHACQRVFLGKMSVVRRRMSSFVAPVSSFAWSTVTLSA